MTPRRTARLSSIPINPAYLGAQAFTNNTAELNALGGTLRNLIAQADTLPSGRGIIRPDSELGAACVMCTITLARNRELAAEVHRLYTILSKKCPIMWQYMRGHSDYKWNECVDNLADLGRRGFTNISAQGGLWEDQTTKTQKPPPAAIPVNRRQRSSHMMGPAG